LTIKLPRTPGKSQGNPQDKLVRRHIGTVRS
jgi:hypothetical protein